MDAMGLLGEEDAAELLGEEAGGTGGVGADEQAAAPTTMSTTLMSDRDRVRSPSSSSLESRPETIHEPLLTSPVRDPFGRCS
jgi:hypothetical protein